MSRRRLPRPAPARARALSRGLLLLAVAAPPAFAGPASDALGQCLVRGTSADDRSVMVRWIFATGSLHPAVQSLASVGDAARDRANREMAQLMQRLLVQTCRAEAAQAMQRDGLPALQAGFEALGRVATQELFSEPHVAAGVGGMVPYLDVGRLLELGLTGR